ncbi:MAG: hypothetical protein LCI00_23960 [Chloroflexi bacterium]|nr:hypothetical protein [Chloroflexota bacterium]MCC6896113.1 hypothetical protein [Anaerolineae bacterium]
MMLKRFMTFLLAACFLLIGWGSALANAAEQSSTASITSFTSSVTTIDADALAGRNVRVPVTWASVNRPDTSNLVFEQVLPDGRVMNVELPRDNSFVPSSGVGVVVPFPPGEGITEVRLRVTLADFVQGTVYDQRELVIPIGGATTVTPTITTFSTSSTNVSLDSLTSKTARVPVSFAVENRPDNSNLVFEQVNGTTLTNVELPRSNPIIPSSGNGVVAPIAPTDAAATSITVRLSLVNLADNSVISQREITLPIIQAAPTTAAISTFTTTATSVTLAALNDKSARLPVTWAAENRPNNSNLFFEQVLENGTAVNVELPRSNPFVSSSGSGVVAPVAPSSMTATNITLRVRLVDLGSQSTLAENTITVPLAAAPPAPVPTITTFSTTTTTISSTALDDKTARIPVAFAVENRPANSNLVFEQVDGSNVVNVELPRSNPIIPSSGNGAVAPIAPADTAATSITLQLRVVDLASKTTLAQQTITVGITRIVPGAPNIRSFTTSAQGVTRTALLNKTARVGVAWAVDNRPANANLVFEQVFEDNTAVNIELPRQNPTVPSSGSGVVAPNAPKNSTTTTITIRVRLIESGSGKELALQSITLPVINDPNAPAISAFNALVAADGIDRAALYAGTYQVAVTWASINRPANTNLAFEQVLENGTAVNVELPRSNPIIPSSGTGTVKLVAPQNADASTVTLRLRLINLSSNSTITQVDITKPIKGAPAVQPTAAAPQPTATTPVTGSGTLLTVTSFTVSPNPVARNGAVTLTWSVAGGATRVKIDRLSEFSGQTTETILDEQPASGSAPYTIPAEYVNSATFQLSAFSADGQETLQDAVVNLTCPFTDQLTPDSCPATQATNVDTAVQTFEKGMMIWRGDTRQIYVLFNDGTWQEVDDTWVEGDNVGTDPAPDGLIKPERGFGKVWFQIAGVSVLGWATTEESSYTTTWEMYPLVDADQMILVPHFKLPDGRTVRVGSFWQVQ